LDGKGEKACQHKIHTHFMLNEGDMLFLPALWFHYVESCGEENISLNWVFTKKAAQVATEGLKRDYERYLIAEYFLKHPYQFNRQLFRLINGVLPNYLRIIWQYDEMVKTPYSANLLNLMARVLKELSALPKMMFHVSKIRPYLKSIKSVKRLEKGQ
jgi:5-methylcytosine-specific restriction endonuclease McrBC regulatory subunit McrC